MFARFGGMKFWHLRPVDESTLQVGFSPLGRMKFMNWVLIVLMKSIT